MGGGRRHRRGAGGTIAWWLLGTFTQFDIGPGGLTLPEALLLGVIVSSTDAAALFALFRGGGPKPTHRIRSLLELESGTNDPMAVILTTTLLELLTLSTVNAGEILLDLLVQMTLGIVAGVSLGWVGARLTNRLSVATPGLYPILVLAMGLIAFGLTEVIGGNEFGLASAGEVFNVVFFIVVVSVLVQGLTLGPAARRLGVTGTAQ